VRAKPLLYFIFLACLLSSAAATSSTLLENKATRWFQQEYESYLAPSESDQTPPAIYGVSISPTVLKCGDPRTEINAYIHDQAGIEMVYADIGSRMNLMLDLDLDRRYTGYCGSNLPAGTYKVTIVAIDKAGNAARDETARLTIVDPNDLNGNRIEDSLERQKDQNLKVIVLHDGNLSGLEAAEKLNVLPASSVTLPGERLEEISKISGVKGIYKDQKLKVMASPSQSISRSNTNIIKKSGLDGEGVTVALIDTGADTKHQSLKDKIIVFQDFVNDQTEAYDDNGHGTHCASLIAGEEGIGIAPGAKLAVVKVMDRDGACYLSDALKALDWCLENKDRYGIKIVSFSVGGESPSDGTSLLDEACNRMVEEGLVMCVAAGNSGPEDGSIVIPGDADQVITVGAIDEKGAIFELSSRGSASSEDIKPDLVTLGVDVVSALAGSKDGYSSMSGTSMAVPQVSGAAALVLQAQPNLDPSDVKRILLKTADDLGATGPDYVYGYGALNLSRALASMSLRPAELRAPVLESVELSRDEGQVGNPVMIEARATGEIKAISSRVKGPDRSLEIPMDDFDLNGIYSARWETSFWTPGDYDINVEMQGKFGEKASLAVPFYLNPKT
jgi:serine protease AprX